MTHVVFMPMPGETESIYVKCEKVVVRDWGVLYTTEGETYAAPWHRIEEVQE